MAETLMANGGQRFAGGGISNIQRMAAGGVPKYTFDALTGKYTPVSDTISSVSSDAAPKYTYDPITQRYTLDTSDKKEEEKKADTSKPSYDQGGTGISSNPEWENMTPAQQAAFYSANPLFASITQLGQKGFANTLLGKVQNALMPNLQPQQAAIAAGFAPSNFSNSGLAVAADQEAAAQQNAAQQNNIAAGLTVSGDAESAAAEAAANAAGAGGFDSDFMAQGGLAALAQGGISNLGDYSDGGRLLRGPGDGVSDSIPATIANKQPARLADGEFVVPARIVSELGNGSTEAGARKLYQMLARVQNARKKSIGQGRVAVNSRADKMLPA